MTSKIPFIIICAIVALLLAPYAGCNEGDVQSNLPSDERAVHGKGLNTSRQRDNGIERGSSAGANESLDRIEDLLAN